MSSGAGGNVLQATAYGVAPLRAAPLYLPQPSRAATGTVPPSSGPVAAQGRLAAEMDEVRAEALQRGFRDLSASNGVPRLVAIRFSYVRNRSIISYLWRHL
jgi:hypothetical protein